MNIIFLIFVYALATAIFMAVLFLVHQYWRRVQKLDVVEAKIIKKLKDNGYKNGKEEGVLFFEKGGLRFDVNFVQEEKRLIQVYLVAYMSIDTEEEKVSYVGKTLLANSVNFSNPQTTMVASKDLILCRSEFMIRNAKDFFNELDEACSVSVESFKDAVEILPKIKKDYLEETEEKKKKIGF